VNGTTIVECDCGRNLVSPSLNPTRSTVCASPIGSYSTRRQSYTGRDTRALSRRIGEIVGSRRFRNHLRGVVPLAEGTCQKINIGTVATPVSRDDCGCRLLSISLMGRRRISRNDTPGGMHPLLFVGQTCIVGYTRNRQQRTPSTIPMEPLACPKEIP
jgi:hypothetical protein